MRIWQQCAVPTVAARSGSGGSGGSAAGVGDSGYLASLPSEQDAPGVELTFMLEFQCQEPEEKEPDLAAHLEQGPNYEGLD